jgi:hypothetical protein
MNEKVEDKQKKPAKRKWLGKVTDTNVIVLADIFENLEKPTTIRTTLEKLNYTVNVEVKRFSDWDGVSLTNVWKEKLRRLGATNKAQYVHALSKFKRMCQDVLQPVHQLHARRELDVLNEIAGGIAENYARHTNYIFPNGGSTKVSFTHPVTGKVYTGESKCFVLDPFNHTKGLQSAWGQLYGSLLEDFPTGKKLAKRMVKQIVNDSTEHTQNTQNQ